MPVYLPWRQPTGCHKVLRNSSVNRR
jgi:hypothetical protein